MIRRENMIIVAALSLLVPLLHGKPVFAVEGAPTGDAGK